MMSTLAHQPYRELDTVVLARDPPDAGLQVGDLGAVVLVHGPITAPEALDVEFVTASGRTQALRTLRPGDVRPMCDDDLLTVRPVAPIRTAA
jgi:hypothetical protein